MSSKKPSLSDLLAASAALFKMDVKRMPDGALMAVHTPSSISAFSALKSKAHKGAPATAGANNT